MNIMYKLKVAFIAMHAMALSTMLQAQLTLDFNQTATLMAQNLAGPGVQIQNAQITGADSSYAYYYSNGTEIGTSNGVLLTTGRAAWAVGPNNSFGICNTLPPYNVFPPCSYFDRNTPGSDLLEESQTTCPGSQEVCTNDACMLEFDIIPQGYDLTFKYTFASEEYQEFVNSPFNDVFGFYISGAGVGTDVNIALVPSTNEFVAINSVNHLENTAYYQSNSNPYGQLIQYDGFTVNLTAHVAGLTPCTPYHLKLIIADGVDGTFDSGVFVEAIESSPILILTATSNGLDYMVEGCNTGTITFARETASPTPQDVTYFVGGTATNGVDYTPTLGSGIFGDPITVTIPANETSVSIEIEALADLLPEGSEYLTVYLDNPACTGNQVIDSTNFYIYDVLEVDITPENPAVCVGNCVELTGNTVADQLGTITWTGGTVSDPDSLIVTVCPTETTTYTLTATVGACTATDQVTVQVSSITVDLVASDSRCFNAGTGSIDVTVIDAVAPYTYVWTGPNGYTSTDGNITGLEPGEYCVTATDSAGCVASGCATIIQTEELVVNGALSDYTCFPISCYGSCDGMVDLTMTGGTAPFTFNWSGPDAYTSDNEDITGLCTGSYMVTVTDSLGCMVEQTYLLLQPDSLIINVLGTVDLLCTGVETGEATVSSSGGCGPFTFAWSHDANVTGPVASNLGSGSYLVSVTDINGCSNDGSVTIVINDPIDPINMTLDSISVYEGGFNTSCPGSEDGFIDIVVAGGTLPYTFSWMNDDENTEVATTEDLTNAPCGNYTVTISDDNGCIITQSFIITCVPAITATYEVVSNPCGAPEAGIGSIEILTIGGGHGAPYTISWDGPSCPCPADSMLTGLNSGDYTLTLTDTLGCNTTITINVGQNDVFTAGGTVTNLSCYQSCDGMIDVEIVPAGTYNFVWSGPFSGTPPTSEDVSGLCAGSYSVVISADDCEETFTFEVTEPVAIEAEGVITNPICFGQNSGSIDITVTNGSGFYTYDWTAPGGCFFSGSQDQNISNLFECTYTVVVTDTITDCTVTADFTLDAPQVMSLVVLVSEVAGGYNVSCNAANDGFIQVFVTGGTPDSVAFDPYSYLFDWLGADCADVDPALYGNDPNASSISGLPAGSYGVNVTDINGCLATTCIDLIEPDTLATNAVIQNIICADPAGGSIDPGITGGNGVYTYNWSGNIGPGQADDAILTNLDAGTYTLTLTDENGCSKVFQYTITETIPPAVAIDNITPASCFGVCNGSITYTIGAEGNTTPILECYLNDVAITDTIGVNSITELCAGSYTLVIIDINNCQTTITFDITSPDPLVTTITSVVQYPEQIYDLQCNGDNNGQLIATVAGGTPDYTYTWVDANDVVIGNDTTITSLIAGNYCVQIADANGCMDTLCYEITEPELPLSAESTVSLYNETYNVSCFGSSDGTIDVVVAGGVEPYIYDWTGDGTVDGTPNQTGLSEGSYVLLITDANFCTLTLNFELTSPEEISITSVEEVSPLCADDCNGSISIDVAGGSGVYTYVWTGPDGFTSASADIADLCPGNYDLTVTDDLGCTQTYSTALSNPEPIVATIVADYNCGTAEFDLCAVASGGSGTYSYSWSTGATTQCITVDADGEFCVTVTDSNGCSVVVCQTVDVGPILSITGTVTNASCGLCNGSIDVTIAGGVAPLTIVWTGAGTVAGQEDQANLCAGAYTVTVTDANLCVSSSTFTINQNNPIVTTVSTVNISCNGRTDGSASVTTTGATGTVTYSWLDSDENEIGTGTSVSNLAPGTYLLQWQDAAGCSGENPFTITQPAPLSVDIIVSQYGAYNISSVGGNDGCILLDVTGGTPSYIYDWTPDQGADTVSNPCGLIAGDYTVVITDGNGCRLDTTVTLIQPEDLMLPTGLSPNGDTYNDTYYIPGAYLCRGSLFKVFNRWGNLVYEKDNYDNDWYGQTTDGDVLADGTYFVIFEGCDKKLSTYVDLRRE